tara:strand:+ start:536 stop:931 length:396 start_codon:yes stop_codon:yes gene_type:complete
MKKQTDYPSYKNRVWQKVLYSKLKDNLDTCGLMEVPKEATSPEDYFDNGVIRDTIEDSIEALSNSSGRGIDKMFSKYNHGEIYRLRLAGYSNVEIGKIHNASVSTVSQMLIWIETRFKKILNKKLDFYLSF